MYRNKNYRQMLLKNVHYLRVSRAEEKCHLNGQLRSQSQNCIMALSTWPAGSSNGRRQAKMWRSDYRCERSLPGGCDSCRSCGHPEEDKKHRHPYRALSSSICWCPLKSSQSTIYLLLYHRNCTKQPLININQNILKLLLSLYMHVSYTQHPNCA